MSISFPVAQSHLGLIVRAAGRPCEGPSGPPEHHRSAVDGTALAGRSERRRRSVIVRGSAFEAVNVAQWSNKHHCEVYLHKNIQANARERGGA